MPQSGRHQKCPTVSNGKVNDASAAVGLGQTFRGKKSTARAKMVTHGPRTRKYSKCHAVHHKCLDVREIKTMMCIPSTHRGSGSASRPAALLLQEEILTTADHWRGARQGEDGAHSSAHVPSSLHPETHHHANDKRCLSAPAQVHGSGAFPSSHGDGR